MNLKKRWIAVAAVCAVTAAALYSSTLPMSGMDESRGGLLGSSKKETLYFWYADESMTDYIESAAVSFGEKNGVRILPVLVSDGQYLEAISEASVAEEQLPDLFLLGNDSLERAYLAGLASEARDESNILNTNYFPQTALDAVTYKGHVIGYPLSFETSALLYNQTYMQEWAKQQVNKELPEEDPSEEESEESSEEVAEGDETVEGEDLSVDEARVEELANEYLVSGMPSTVSDVLTIADTFDVPEGVEGIMEWDVSDILYNYWIVGKYAVVGGPTGDDAGNVNLENQEVIDCLESYKSLNQFFSMESDTIQYEDVVQDFVDGKIVFTIATPDVVKYLEEAKAEGTFVYDYGLCQMPDVSAELGSSSMSVTTSVVVNGYSTHKETANRFATYLTNTYAGELYQKSGKIPAGLKVSLPYEGLEIFRLEYAKSTPIPKLMEAANFWMHMEVLFAKIWNGADVPQAVHELAEQMNVQLRGVVAAETAE